MARLDEVATLERAFHVRLLAAVHTVEFADGWVPELDDVSRIVAAVTGADDVRDVIDREPLIAWSIDGKAFLFGDEAEWHWQDLLRRPVGEHPLDAAQAQLIRACAEQPTLRQLLPYTSHWHVCFSRCTRYPFTDEGPFIEPSADHDGVAYVVTATVHSASSTALRTRDPLSAALAAASLVPPNRPAIRGHAGACDG
ncbi:DUF6193 family natural product biosynthesis protein [Solirubrobacter phytolaccae]|uniref:DUF6193 family natural product biosynthesis protein n=1 Tax=Solirubrobacter phytolaccae TaxID=1404360 RepID=A0A9X3N4K9_9ACTN|nr:DUF6193 family natural product biosynthesis protein [Solirubrobacter phytolaccae]MDA0179401.1 DUF6193 family natural product biosynthesis protein [Solirubrobacter phytolaccae]